MSPTTEEIRTFWPIIVAGLFFVIWLIRLEAKVLYQGKDHIKLEEAVKLKDETMWKKFDSIGNSMNLILQAVSRMEGRFLNRNEETK